ncbi:glycosyltransferase family 2 protein [Niabella ginsengisoli]|uniref:Glycosyltransferase family 2 protein n=1 Tax=Niabella ginsengisoli TaxID=522298 RepID=A0ABS9SH22_9BACT|nr:glycosyltransferase family 2 protein [Niabella ginsengisoli]MCH5597635.1 glycosyltransferase family 2 protein [Niabella ginsengisoli]
MMNSPLVSVIIPTYNRAKTLPKAIVSVLSQTYQNYEIIVVDDGSADNTKEVVEQYNSVQYIYKENGGQASARNTGLTLAKGSFIASLDSDDEWYPEFLQKSVEKMVAEDLDFVFANWDQQNSNGQFCDFLSTNIFLAPYFPHMKDGWVTLDSDELRHIYIQGCPSPSSSLLMTKEFVSPGWNTDIKIGDDWYLLVRSIYKTKRKAAFTLDKLWKKCIDDINIYDGRKRSEVLEYLYISDMEKMLRDFKDQMTRSEFKLMQKSMFTVW